MYNKKTTQKLLVYIKVDNEAEALKKPLQKTPFIDNGSLCLSLDLPADPETLQKLKPGVEISFNVEREEDNICYITLK